MTQPPSAACPAGTSCWMLDNPPPATPAEPPPIPLNHLHLQDVTCCEQPMRLRHTRSTWTGKPGHGYEHLVTTRTCNTCNASAITSTATPS